MPHPSGATRFVGHMDLGTINAQIGVETPWIPFHFTAIIDPGRNPAVNYYGPGTGVRVANLDYQNAYGYITQIADQGQHPTGSIYTGPFFPGGGWSGFVKYVPKMSSGGVPGTPNAITFALSCADDVNGLSGAVDNWCLVVLPSAPPVTKHLWEIRNHGQQLVGVQIADPEDVSIWRDGQMVYPNYMGGPS